MSFIGRVKGLEPDDFMANTAGNIRRSFKPLVHLEYVEEDDLIVPVNGNNWKALTRNEILELIEELQKLYNQVPDEIIIEYERLDSQAESREILKGLKVRGYVYLIHATDTDRYKIGHAQDVMARLQNLSRQSAFPLELIHCFEVNNAYGFEQALHLKYAEKRAHGEWFELAIEDVEAIKAMPGELPVEIQRGNGV